MKSYDSIPYWNKGQFGKPCIAFYKEDGSNMRFEYSSKRKEFYKFGTKNVMIDKSNSEYGKGIDIFLNKYSDNLIKIFFDKYRKVESFVVFAEFFGENSFSGKHIESDKKDVVIFDISVYKHGLMSPYEFLNNFKHLHIPKVIYQGEYNMDFINDVRENKLNLKEGVVCKGTLKNNLQWSAKVKTNDWLRKVKEKLGNKALLEELNGDKELYEITI